MKNEEELTIEQRISNVLEYLGFKEIKERGSRVYVNTGKKLFSPRSTIDDLRIMLGFDQQCFHCLQYKFKFDLTTLEETTLLVCQECAEKILNGEADLSKSSAYLNTKS